MAGYLLSGSEKITASDLQRAFLDLNIDYPVSAQQTSNTAKYIRSSQALDASTTQNRERRKPATGRRYIINQVQRSRRKNRPLTKRQERRTRKVANYIYDLCSNIPFLRSIAENTALCGQGSEYLKAILRVSTEFLDDLVYGRLKTLMLPEQRDFLVKMIKQAGQTKVTAGDWEMVDEATKGVVSMFFGVTLPTNGTASPPNAWSNSTTAPTKKIVLSEDIVKFNPEASSILSSCDKTLMKATRIQTTMKDIDLAFVEKRNSTKFKGFLKSAYRKLKLSNDMTATYAPLVEFITRVERVTNEFVALSKVSKILTEILTKLESVLPNTTEWGMSTLLPWIQREYVERLLCVSTPYDDLNVALRGRVIVPDISDLTQSQIMAIAQNPAYCSELKVSLSTGNLDILRKFGFDVERERMTYFGNYTRYPHSTGSNAGLIGDRISQASAAGTELTGNRLSTESSTWTEFDRANTNSISYGNGNRTSWYGNGNCTSSYGNGNRISSYVPSFPLDNRTSRLLYADDPIADVLNSAEFTYSVNNNAQSTARDSSQVLKGILRPGSNYPLTTTSLS